MSKATCINCLKISDCHQVHDVGFVCSDCRPKFLPRNIDKLVEQWAQENVSEIEKTSNREKRAAERVIEEAKVTDEQMRQRITI